MFLNTPSFYLADNVFYLNETSRWNYIVFNKSKNNIANIIDTAMKDIEEVNVSLKGALEQNFYGPLNLQITQLSSLIDEINKISEEKFQDKDLIGRVYEYFLSVFSIYEGKAGEYYTPKTIVDLIAELIEPYSEVSENNRIYDPCCGSGGMFIQALKWVKDHNLDTKRMSIFGQEENSTTYKLAKMNLAIRGMANNLGEKAISTFTNDQHKDTKMNFIMANPPFNLKNWYIETLSDDARWNIGGELTTPPASNANYAWILHMLSKLDVTNGIAGFLLANGALGAGGKSSDDNENNNAEYKIRKQLILQNKVEAIFVLPREMFYSTDISVTLWILNNNKKERTLTGRHLRNRQKEVLFVDLRTWNQNLFDKKFVIFTEEQIKAIKTIYSNWQDIDTTKYQDVPELSKSVKKEQIIAKDYSLVPSKYIEFIDHDLDIDYEKEMIRIQKEMKELLIREKETHKMLEEAFKGIGFKLDE
jgi:type I restriction enzyme M protein